MKRSKVKNTKRTSRGSSPSSKAIARASPSILGESVRVGRTFSTTSPTSNGSSTFTRRRDVVSEHAQKSSELNKANITAERRTIGRIPQRADPATEISSKLKTTFKSSPFFYRQVKKEHADSILMDDTTQAHNTVDEIRHFVDATVVNIDDPVLRETVRIAETDSVKLEHKHSEKLRDYLMSTMTSNEKIKQLIDDGASNRVILNAMYNLLPRVMPTYRLRHNIDRLDWMGGVRHRWAHEVEPTGYDVEDSSDYDNLPQQRPFSKDEMNRLLQDVEESKFIESDVEEALFAPAATIADLRREVQQKEITEQLKYVLKNVSRETPSPDRLDYRTMRTEFKILLGAPRPTGFTEKLSPEEMTQALIDNDRSRTRVNEDGTKNLLSETLPDELLSYQQIRRDKFGLPFLRGVETGEVRPDELLVTNTLTNAGLGLMPPVYDVTDLPLYRREESEEEENHRDPRDPFDDAFAPFQARFDLAAATVLNRVMGPTGEDIPLYPVDDLFDTRPISDAPKIVDGKSVVVGEDGQKHIIPATSVDTSSSSKHILSSAFPQGQTAAVTIAGGAVSDASTVTSSSASQTPIAAQGTAATTATESTGAIGHINRVSPMEYDIVSTKGANLHPPQPSPHGYLATTQFTADTHVTAPLSDPLRRGTASTESLAVRYTIDGTEPSLDPFATKSYTKDELLDDIDSINANHIALVDRDRSLASLTQALLTETIPAPGREKAETTFNVHSERYKLPEGIVAPQDLKVNETGLMTDLENDLSSEIPRDIREGPAIYTDSEQYNIAAPSSKDATIHDPEAAALRDKLAEREELEEAQKALNSILADPSNRTEEAHFNPIDKYFLDNAVRSLEALEPDATFVPKHFTEMANDAGIRMTDFPSSYNRLVQRLFDGEIDKHLSKAARGLTREEQLEALKPFLPQWFRLIRGYQLHDVEASDDENIMKAIEELVERRNTAEGDKPKTQQKKKSGKKDQEPTVEETKNAAEDLFSDEELRLLHLSKKEETEPESSVTEIDYGVLGDSYPRTVPIEDADGIIRPHKLRNWEPPFRTPDHRYRDIMDLEGEGDEIARLRSKLSKDIWDPEHPSNVDSRVEWLNEPNYDLDAPYSAKTINQALDSWVAGDPFLSYFDSIPKGIKRAEVIRSAFSLIPPESIDAAVRSRRGDDEAVAGRKYNEIRYISGISKRNLRKYRQGLEMYSGVPPHILDFLELALTPHERYLAMNSPEENHLREMLTEERLAQPSQPVLKPRPDASDVDVPYISTPITIGGQPVDSRAQHVQSHYKRVYDTERYHRVQQFKKDLSSPIPEVNQDSETELSSEEERIRQFMFDKARADILAYKEDSDFLTDDYQAENLKYSYPEEVEAYKIRRARALKQALRNEKKGKEDIEDVIGLSEFEDDGDEKSIFTFTKEELAVLGDKSLERGDHENAKITLRERLRMALNDDGTDYEQPDVILQPPETSEFDLGQKALRKSLRDYLAEEGADDNQPLDQDKAEAILDGRKPTTSLTDTSDDETMFTNPNARHQPVAEKKKEPTDGELVAIFRDKINQLPVRERLAHIMDLLEQRKRREMRTARRDELMGTVYGTQRQLIRRMCDELQISERSQRTAFRRIFSLDPLYCRELVERHLLYSTDRLLTSDDQNYQPVINWQQELNYVETVMIGTTTRMNARTGGFFPGAPNAANTDKNVFSPPPLVAGEFAPLFIDNNMISSGDEFVNPVTRMYGHGGAEFVASNVLEHATMSQKAPPLRDVTDETDPHVKQVTHSRPYVSANLLSAARQQIQEDFSQFEFTSDADTDSIELSMAQLKLDHGSNIALATAIKTKRDELDAGRAAFEKQYPLVEGEFNENEDYRAGHMLHPSPNEPVPFAATKKRLERFLNTTKEEAYIMKPDPEKLIIRYNNFIQRYPTALDKLKKEHILAFLEDNTEFCSPQAELAKSSSAEQWSNVAVVPEVDPEEQKALINKLDATYSKLPLYHPMRYFWSAQPIKSVEKDGDVSKLPEQLVLGVVDLMGEIDHGDQQGIPAGGMAYSTGNRAGREASADGVKGAGNDTFTANDIINALATPASADAKYEEINLSEGEAEVQRLREEGNAFRKAVNNHPETQLLAKRHGVDLITNPDEYLTDNDQSDILPHLRTVTIGDKTLPFDKSGKLPADYELTTLQSDDEEVIRGEYDAYKNRDIFADKDFNNVNPSSDGQKTVDLFKAKLSNADKIEARPNDAALKTPEKFASPLDVVTAPNSLQEVKTRVVRTDNNLIVDKAAAEVINAPTVLEFITFQDALQRGLDPQHYRSAAQNANIAEFHQHFRNALDASNFSFIKGKSKDDFNLSDVYGTNDYVTSFMILQAVHRMVKTDGPDVVDQMFRGSNIDLTALVEKANFGGLYQYIDSIQKADLEVKQSKSGNSEDGSRSLAFLRFIVKHSKDYAATMKALHDERYKELYGKAPSALDLDGAEHLKSLDQKREEFYQNAFKGDDQDVGIATALHTSLKNTHHLASTLTIEELDDILSTMEQQNPIIRTVMERLLKAHINAHPIRFVPDLHVKGFNEGMADHTAHRLRNQQILHPEITAESHQPIAIMEQLSTHLIDMSKQYPMALQDENNSENATGASSMKRESLNKFNNIIIEYSLLNANAYPKPTIREVNVADDAGFNTEKLAIGTLEQYDPREIARGTDIIPYQVFDKVMSLSPEERSQFFDYMNYVQYHGNQIAVSQFVDKLKSDLAKVKELPSDTPSTASALLVRELGKSTKPFDTHIVGPSGYVRATEDFRMMQVAINDVNARQLIGTDIGPHRKENDLGAYFEESTDNPAYNFRHFDSDDTFLDNDEKTLLRRFYPHSRLKQAEISADASDGQTDYYDRLAQKPFKDDRPEDLDITRRFANPQTYFSDPLNPRQVKIMKSIYEERRVRAFLSGKMNPFDASVMYQNFRLADRAFDLDTIADQDRDLARLHREIVVGVVREILDDADVDLNHLERDAYNVEPEFNPEHKHWDHLNVFAARRFSPYNTLPISESNIPPIIGIEQQRNIYNLHLLDPVTFHPRWLARRLNIPYPYMVAILKTYDLRHKVNMKNMLLPKEDENGVIDGSLEGIDNVSINPGYDKVDVHLPNPPEIQLEHLDQEYLFSRFAPNLIGRVSWSKRPERTKDFGMRHNISQSINIYGSGAARRIYETERDLVRRFQSHEQVLDAIEQASFARFGPITYETTKAGDLHRPPKLPREIISTTVHPPSRHNWALTTLDERKNAVYGIQIRDRDGYLRHPTFREFKNIRNRERDRRIPFYLRKYHVVGKLPDISNMFIDQITQIKRDFDRRTNLSQELRSTYDIHHQRLVKVDTIGTMENPSDSDAVDFTDPRGRFSPSALLGQELSQLHDDINIIQQRREKREFYRSQGRENELETSDDSDYDELAYYKRALSTYRVQRIPEIDGDLANPDVNGSGSEDHINDPRFAEMYAAMKESIRSRGRPSKSSDHESSGSDSGPEPAETSETDYDSHSKFSRKRSQQDNDSDDDNQSGSDLSNTDRDSSGLEGLSELSEGEIRALKIPPEFLKRHKSARNASTSFAPSLETLPYLDSSSEGETAAVADSQDVQSKMQELQRLNRENGNRRVMPSSTNARGNKASAEESDTSFDEQEYYNLLVPTPRHVLTPDQQGIILREQIEIPVDGETSLNDAPISQKYNNGIMGVAPKQDFSTDVYDFNLIGTRVGPLSHYPEYIGDKIENNDFTQGILPVVSDSEMETFFRDAGDYLIRQRASDLLGMEASAARSLAIKRGLFDPSVVTEEKDHYGYARDGSNGVLTEDGLKQRIALEALAARKHLDDDKDTQH